jgi:hypothetical protein
MTIEVGSFAVGSFCGAGRALTLAARTQVPKTQINFVIAFPPYPTRRISSIDANRGFVDVNSENDASFAGLGQAVDESASKGKSQIRRSSGIPSPPAVYPNSMRTTESTVGQHTQNRYTIPVLRESLPLAVKPSSE